MFTVGGRNVYPAEIESALSAHPDVLSCLVVGVPDDDWARCRTRSCRPTGSTRPTSIAFLADRIASYKVPRTVEFSDTPAARRRRQGAPVGGARRGHRATAGSGAFADRTIQRWHWTFLAAISQRRSATRHGDSTSA